MGPSFGLKLCLPTNINNFELFYDISSARPRLLGVERAEACGSI